MKISFIIKILVWVLCLKISHVKCQNVSREQRIVLETYLEILRILQEPEKKIVLADKILKVHSVNSDAIAHRALSHMEMNNFQAALNDFNLYMEHKPNSGFCVYRGMLKIKMGDTLGGLTDFDKAMSLSGNAPETFDKISLVFKTEKYIIPYCEKVIQSNPNTVMEYIILGIIKEREQDFKGAVEKYRKAYQILMNQPFSDRVYYGWFFELKAEVEYKLNNYQQAVEAISESILLQPEKTVLYTNRITYYMAKGDQQRACEDFFRLYTLKEKYSLSSSIRCEMKNINKKRMDEWSRQIDAENLYLEACASKGNDSAKIYKAIACYSKALEIKPSHIYARADRASYYIILQQPDKALKDLDTLIKISSECASAYHYRAEAYRMLGNYQQAISDEGNAILLDSTNVEYWIKRASLRTDIGDTITAIADFSKGLWLNNHYSMAYFQRGFLSLHMRKNYEAALKDFLKAIELEENEPLNRKPSGYYFYCAQAYDKLLMYNEALNTIEKAIAIDPKDKSYYYLCGEIKARMKDMHGACIDWHYAKKLGYEKVDEVILYNCKD